MTLEEKYKKTNDSTYNDRILKAIRQNLNKYKFKTQEEILIFLKKKNLSTTQPTLSRILRANNIIKNSSNIYEDIDEKIKSQRLSEIFNRSNASICKPMIYSAYLNDTENENNYKPGLYFILIKVDIGYENFLYEVLSDYLGKKIFMYIVGHGCIQVLYNNIKTLNSIHIKLKNIKKLPPNYNL